MNDYALIADIGGTNARFALVDIAGKIEKIHVYQCNNFDHIENAIDDYLQMHKIQTPTKIAIAVATPVNADRIKLTNHHWSFSIRELKTRFNLTSLKVINDFTAQALAVRSVQPDHYIKFGSGESQNKANAAIIGPGTGLGVSGLIYADGHWHPITGEGGHVSFYPTTKLGKQVIEQLGKHYEHVSAERVLAGQGIVNIYRSLCELNGNDFNEDISPSEITSKALNKQCPISSQTLDLYFNMFGTVAGNLALTLGAFKGVYITGGIIPKVQTLFLKSTFREAFEAHGRFRSYLEKIPTYLITHPYFALMGLSQMIIDDGD